MGLFARLAARLQRQPEPKAPRSNLPTQPLSTQLQRIGGAVTPEQLSTYLQAADVGYTYQLCDLANESRERDCHLQSVLYTRENALCGLGLQVVPHIERGKREPSERDAEVAAFVEDALLGATGEGQDVRSLADAIVHLQSAAYFGYAMAEIAWTVAGGRQVPLGFRCHPHRRFGFRHTDGALVHWDQAINGAQVVPQEAWPGMWLQHQPRVIGDIPAREGLLRPLLWAALFRNWDLADWMRLAELSWKPWREGIYKRDASDDDVDHLTDILEYMAGQGVCSHSEDTELRVHWPVSSGQGSRSAHQALAEFMAAEMSKAVLGQTLTTEAGERGARSLGEVHDRVRKDLREADAVAVAATLRRDLVTWLVRLNYGDAVPVPDVRFATDDAPDRTELADAVSKLVSAGVDVPMYWVHDEAGIPTPEEGDLLVGGSEYGAEPEDEDEEPDEDEDDGEDVDLSDLDEAA